MDIQHLVDRLEDLVDEGRHVFGTKYTMVDEERALELIDQMRISIPEEIEKSTRILAQRDRVLADANEEAARIIAMARRQGEDMLTQEQAVVAAQTRARHIIEQAKQEATKITREADDYVLHTLSQLEQRIVQIQGEVRNGITVLQSPPQEEAPAQPPQPVHVPQPVEKEVVEVSVDAGEK